MLNSLLDLVPGNSSIVATYRNLKAVCKAYVNRAIVIPVVCMEYYFIKSIAAVNITLFKDHKIVTDCIEKKTFFESALIETREDFDYCKYFERFCKLIIKNVRDCIKTTSSNNVA